jgi:alginate O-acetyltransferase complex protein AlgI
VLACFAWIFFRANSNADAFLIAEKIVRARGVLYMGTLSVFIYSILAILFLVLSEIKKEHFDVKFAFFCHKNQVIRHFSYASIIILILLFGVFDGGQFIYFQF